MQPGKPVIRAVLCDIEGTIGSIAFVRDVLFPYAARKLPGFVRANCFALAVRRQLGAVAAETGIASDDLEALIRQLLDWLDADVKATPLKALQGMIWEHGYRHGDFEADVYEDAWRKLEQWNQDGMPVYIYSSGSVQAQELFFEHSCHGDMRPLISGYFDTTIGPKKDPASYRRIAEAIQIPASSIRFLSDVESELDAAAEAGSATTWVLRPGDWPLDAENIRSPHALARSFDDVVLQR